MPLSLPILDEDVALGFKLAAGGWKTSVVPGGGGAEYRNKVWELPRRRFEFSYDNRDDYEVLLAFVDEVFGMHGAFLLKPWGAHSLDDQIVLTATGGETTFQIRQIWGTLNQFSRDILYVKPGTLEVTVDDTPLDGEESPPEFTEEDGEVTLASPLSPGDVVRVTCEFYTKVRFEADSYMLGVNGPRASFADMTSISAIEVR